MKKTITLLAVLIILTMAGWLIFFDTNPENKVAAGDNLFFNLTSKPQKGSPAPEFVLKDLNSVDRKLSDYRGKPVLVNFWSVDCAPCLNEMPVLQSAYEKTKGNLVVLGINMGDPKNRVTSFVQSNKITFTILTDSDGQVSQTYRIVAYPVSYFIDADGTIKDYHTGQLSTELLKTYLGKLGLTSW